MTTKKLFVDVTSDVKRKGFEEIYNKLDLSLNFEEEDLLLIEEYLLRKVDIASSEVIEAEKVALAYYIGKVLETSISRARVKWNKSELEHDTFSFTDDFNLFITTDKQEKLTLNPYLQLLNKKKGFLTCWFENILLGVLGKPGKYVETPDGYKGEGSLRVWFVVNAPRAAQYKYVNSLEEAILFIDEEAKRQLKDEMIYSNAFGLEVLEEGQWSEWIGEETGEDVSGLKRKISDAKLHEVQVNFLPKGNGQFSIELVGLSNEEKASYCSTFDSIETAAAELYEIISEREELKAIG